jgi:hypothetical protein
MCGYRRPEIPNQVRDSTTASAYVGTVLVVDDDPISRDSDPARLARQGLRIEVAAWGE